MQHDTSSASAQFTIQANLQSHQLQLLFPLRVSSFSPSYLSHLETITCWTQIFTHFSAKASLSWRSWQFHRKLDFVLDRRRHSEAPDGATRDRGRDLVHRLAGLSIRSRSTKFHNRCFDGLRRPLGSRAIVESARSIERKMKNSENFWMPFANNFPNVRKHLEGLKHFPLWTFWRFSSSKA